MLLRIESPFVQLANKLRNPFSEEEKVKLARALESSYDKVRSVMLAQEATKAQSKPTVITLGNLGTRFFILNIYYNDDEMYDDIPMSIRQILPSISPVRIDVMADLQHPY
jgi:predicted neutral ceramidase superfamily lipid hydrolase